ncbi:MAG: BamA/TamA family outer membrane protein [Bacteroidia bacterium]|nr:BamA/TamA family outer membrane protein [Bacteroidia bacterium]
MKLRFVLISFCLLIYSFASAQLAQPTSNRGKLFKVEAEHLEVYAFQQDIPAANKIARMAEQARYELGILYDYRPIGDYKFVYFPSAQALTHSNLEWGEEEYHPGRIQLPDGTGIIIHPGTSRGLYQEVRKAVARVILEEFASGNRFSTMLQKDMLLYDAQWFLEGLVEYTGSPLSYAEESIIAGALEKDLIGLAIEGNGEVNRILRKSIWHYIVHEYGEQKISEIVYLVNISHSIESGIISVLGITLNTLTLRWEKFLQTRSQNLIVNRDPINDYSPSADIQLPKGQSLAGMDFSQDSSKIVAYLNANGLLQVSVYDLNSRTWEATPIKSNFKHGHADLLAFRLPVKWHPSKAMIYAPVLKNATYQLAVYDLEEKKVTYRELPENVNQIYQIDFTHNGKRMVFSALHRGRIDIYAGPSLEGSFKALTNDAFDNLDPVWSEDDQSIFFVSNRNPKGDRSVKAQLYSYQNAFDLYQLIPTGDTSLVVNLSTTPHINERYPQVAGTSEIWYLSDRSGIYNLESMDVFSHKSRGLTNLAVGLRGQRLDGSTLLAAQPEGESVSLFLLERSQFRKGKYPDPTIQRLEDDSRRKIAERKEQLKKEKLEKILLEKEKISEKKEGKKEVVKEESKPKKKKSPRYYIFDDEDEPYEVKTADKESISGSTPRVQNKSPNTVFGRTPKPSLESIDVSRAQFAGSPFRTDFTGLNFYYDPISTLGLQFDLGFEDLAKNHEVDLQWIPFIRLRVSPRDHIVKASYAYKKNKIDIIGDAGLTTRFLWIQDISTSLDSLIFRYNKVYANVGGRYPLSAQSYVEGKVGILHLDRLDQRLTRLILLNDRDNLLNGEIKAAYENVEEKDGFQIKGFKAEASANYFYSINNNQPAFFRTKAKLNFYQPVYENMVFALQLSGGFSSAKFVPQYYLGGVPGQLHNPLVFQRRDDNRIRANGVDTALYAMHFAEFINPMRGFRYNTRSGSRYVVANLELRIPVSRLLRYSLQPNSLYNIEIVPFIDAGTVWTEGNPFSQRKPTDTQFITSGNVTIKLQTLKSPFLIGMGSGLRIKLLSWTARFDLAWGLDDFVLQRPQLTTSVSKNF